MGIIKTKSPYEEWERQHIGFDGGLWMVANQFNKDKPTIGGFDTETTGLHIIKDTPFLLVFGWLVPGTDYGRVYTFEPTPAAMKMFFNLSSQLEYLVAHNVKYDLHMLTNIGYQKQLLELNNLCENMVVARLSLEAIPHRDGGDSLALKDLGTKYVHFQANEGEKAVKEAMKALQKKRIDVLTAALRQFDMEGEFTATGKPKKWGKGAIEKFLKDPTHDAEDLPTDVREVWITWNKEYPEPTYADVNRELMVSYAGDDVITMLEFFKKAYKTVLQRDQLKVLQLENRAIKPLYKMERVGMKTDLEYLEESRLRVKKEIKRKRFELNAIAGEVVTVNQHKCIKQLFKEKWGISLESADKPNLKRVMKTVEAPEQAKRFAKLINMLRSLEKWYSTYIKRCINSASYDGNSYTQLNQIAAVSGRMSSDFQQMPKKALVDEDGNELFHPRKAYKPKGNGYNKIIYIDYDQIELVVQANYTLLVSGGDLNLCRAYMPFKCKHYQQGFMYDWKNPIHQEHALDKQPSGDSIWLVPETGLPWTRTDVHSETTSKAFPHLELGTDEFKEWRSKGKIFNFLANYGGGKGAAMDSLDLSEEEANALVKGYNEAFPHVVIYQKKIQEQHSKRGYVQNMYGMRYYIQNNRLAYKLANYCVQGTCATALKQAIIELDEYIESNKLKTQMVMPIHDEMQFDQFEGEEHHIPELMNIMANVFKPWCHVPVTAGVEYTETNWKEKVEYEFGA